MLSMQRKIVKYLKVANQNATGDTFQSLLLNEEEWEQLLM